MRVKVRFRSFCSLFACVVLLMGLFSLRSVSAQTIDPEAAFERVLSGEEGPNESADIPGVTTGSEGQIQLPPLIAQMGTLVLLSLMPFFVMLMSSYMKMVIALALLRSALGVPQAPPNQVLNGIALILTIYVMFPVGYQMYERSKPLITKDLTTELASKESAEFIMAVAAEAKEPLKDFLLKNTRAKHVKGFYRLSQKYFPAPVRSDIQPTDFIVIAPAYITSQVEDAFQIGVLIYLPFFVIDLVTSNVLLAMGMMMLSPMTIALPLKLLLLVMLDGWTLLVQGLVTTFKT